MTHPLHTTTLNGLRIAYRVAGQGPDVLLIHGWVSSSRMWSLMMNDLSTHFRCWAIDLPGFADSDKPGASWYSIENYEQVINAFADQFDLGRFDLIGHSMGGMIALRFAARQPTRVRRLVAINPVVTGRVYWDLRLLTGTPLRHSMLALGRWFWPIASSDLLRRHKSLHAHRMSIEWNQATPDSAISAAKAISRHDLNGIKQLRTLPSLPRKPSAATTLHRCCRLSPRPLWSSSASATSPRLTPKVVLPRRRSPMRGWKNSRQGICPPMMYRNRLTLW
ncbi:MAG: alpha/beta hydrolase [Chloroflexi bacterium]|nr:alpha/beta hydrolase [Chloroflexota bacterium]